MNKNRLNTIDEIYRRMYLEYWYALGFTQTPSENGKKGGVPDKGDFNKFYQKLYLKHLYEQGVHATAAMIHDNKEDYQQFLRSFPEEDMIPDTADPEQSIIFRYFFQKDLSPYGVCEKDKNGKRKSDGSKYFPGSVKSEKKTRYRNKKYVDPVKKAENALKNQYQIWERTPDSTSDPSLTLNTDAGKQKPDKALMLMTAYNRYHTHRYETAGHSNKEPEKETILFFRFLLDYTKNIPTGYLETLFDYSAHLKPLFSDDPEIGSKQTVKDALSELIRKLTEKQDKKTVNHLQRISAEAIRQFVDDVLCLSLHEKVKTFFRDLGFPLPEKRKSTPVPESFQARKEDHTLDLLRFYADTQDISLHSEDDPVQKPADSDPADFSDAEADTLLEIMNNAGDAARYLGAFIPLKTDSSGTMLCIMGWDYYYALHIHDYNEVLTEKDRIWKKTPPKPYSFGIIGLAFETTDRKYPDRRSWNKGTRTYTSYREHHCLKYQDLSATLYGDYLNYKDALCEFTALAEDYEGFWEIILQNEKLLAKASPEVKAGIPSSFFPLFGLKPLRDRDFEDEYETNVAGLKAREKAISSSNTKARTTFPRN